MPYSFHWEMQYSLQKQTSSLELNLFQAQLSHLLNEDNDGLYVISGVIIFLSLTVIVLVCALLFLLSLPRPTVFIIAGARGGGIVVVFRVVVIDWSR